MLYFCAFCCNRGSNMMYKSSRSLLSIIKHQSVHWPLCLAHFTLYPVYSMWSLPVVSYMSQCCNLEPHSWTSNIVAGKILPKGWEQFIASTGSDKVFGSCELSSWEELVKHFSPPSILEELSSYRQQPSLHRFVVTQSSNKEKYFCSLAITVDIGHNQKPIAPCYEVQAEEVCLYWNLT